MRNNYLVTIVLLSINISVYIVLNILAWNGIEIYSFVKAYIGFTQEAFHGEYWKHVTPMFVHVEWWHILGNSLAIWAFGTLSERYFGKRVYILVYFISGLLAQTYDLAVACGVDLLIENCDMGAGKSVFGASTCIWGLIGALLVYSIAHKKDLFGSSIRSTLLYVPVMAICIVGTFVTAHGLFKENLLDVLWGFAPHTYGFMEHGHGGAFIVGVILGLLIMILRLNKYSYR